MPHYQNTDYYQVTRKKYDSNGWLIKETTYTKIDGSVKASSKLYHPLYYFPHLKLKKRISKKIA